MSYFATALQTKEAKEAMGQGLVTWFQTGSLNQGINAMFATAETNGSLATAKFGLLLDILKGLSDSYKQ